MKKLLFSILAVMFVTFTVLTAESTTDLWFTWRVSPANEMVTSYVIEQAKAPSTNFVPVVTVVGTTNVGVVKGLTAGSYKFRVVAKNAVGSAPPSNEISYPTNNPAAVVEFQFTVPR